MTRLLPLVTLLAVGCDSAPSAWEAPEVYINELVASNASGLQDASGAYPDWVELWNASDELVDLSSWTLSDDPTMPQKWSFPAGVQLEAGEYLIIFVDGDPSTTEELHTNFRLSIDGETLQLIGPASEDFPIVDSVTFGPQTTDVAYARVPDGGDWAETAPTPDGPNE